MPYQYMGKNIAPLCSSKQVSLNQFLQNGVGQHVIKCRSNTSSYYQDFRMDWSLVVTLQDPKDLNSNVYFCYLFCCLDIDVKQSLLA